jgi:hypothetical protein
MATGRAYVAHDRVGCTPAWSSGCLIASCGRVNGFVANFAQEVLKGQLPLSVRGLCGQGGELFGRGEALFDSVFQRLFSQHVHQFDADES